MELILVGIISGVVTGLGMGGGSILILILVSLFSFEQHVAQATNLVFFIPTAISAIIVHIKNKNIDKKTGKKLLLPTVLGSSVGAYFTKFISTNNLKRYFGIFLLVVGVYEIITTLKEHINERKGEKKK